MKKKIGNPERQDVRIIVEIDQLIAKSKEFNFHNNIPKFEVQLPKAIEDAERLDLTDRLTELLLIRIRILLQLPETLAEAKSVLDRIEFLLNTGSKDELQCRFRKYRGNYHRQTGDIASAIVDLTIAFNYAKKFRSNDEEIIINIQFGIVYWEIGDLLQSLQYFEAAQARAMELNKMNLWAVSLSNIVTIYLHDDLRTVYLEKAELLTKQAEKEFRKTGFAYALAQALVDRGLIAGYKGHKKQARIFYREAQEVLRKTNDKRGHTHILLNLGRALLSDGLVNDAMDNARKAKRLIRSAISSDSIKVALLLGEIYFKNGNYTKALKEFNSALTDAQKLKTPELISNALDRCAELYDRQGQYQMSAECMRKSFNRVVRKYRLGQLKQHRVIIRSIFQAQARERVL